MSDDSTNARHTAAMAGLADAADRLECMAAAAYTLGQKETGNLFADLYADVRADVARARKAFSDELHAHFQSSVQGSLNMLGACMAIDAKGHAPSAGPSHSQE